MPNSARDWDAAAVYWTPWTYWEIKANTDSFNEEEKRCASEREEYEKWFVYLPGLHATYKEAKSYTEEIVKALK